MTDDLKDRLQRLSQRVAERPSAFEQLERARHQRAFRRRVGAGLLAGVIAVAGTLTALLALPGDDRLPLSTGTAPTTLTIWPEDPVHQGFGDPREVQAALDSGDESHAWRTDPRQVVQRFAREFLGWEEVTLDAREAVDRDDGAARGATFAIAPCSPDVLCDAVWQAVILVQPVRIGSDGIWSVAAIQGLSNGSLDLGVEWSEFPPVLEGGSELAHRGDDPRTVVGYVLSDGCRIMSGAYSNSSAEAGASLTLPDMEARTPENGECIDPAVGYVFAWRSDVAVESVELREADPLSNPGRYSLVTIVPVHADLIIGDPAIPTAVTYADPLGWSLDHPAGWYVQPIDWFNGRYSTTGAAFSNESLVPATGERGEGEPWPDLSQLSPEGVVLIVTRRDGDPAPTIDDDSSFPLQPEDAAILNVEPPLDRMLAFRGDGLAFSMVWGGYDHASPALRRALDRMVGSVRFEPWATGEERNGFVSVGSKDRYPNDRGVPISAGPLGTVYVFFGSGNTFVLDLDPDSCGEGQNQTWDAARQEILIECPDGTEVRYLPSGYALPSNPEGFRGGLAAHPLIMSWDDHLLVAVDWEQ